MSLLREIQDAAVSSQIPAADLLRKCKVLASRLGSGELARWVEHELDGYPSTDELPDYRILRNLQSLGHFVGPAGSGAKNAPIPPSCLPEQWQEWAQTEYLMDGIATYEQLLRKESEGIFQSPWPADLLRLYGDQIYEFMHCVQAWKQISRGAIVRLLDAVRNRVLGFALEIEKANPGAGEAPVNSTPIPQETVSQVFHTQIYGNVGNIASGSTGFSQIAEINVAPGDRAGLEAALRELGATSEDIAALHVALGQDREESAPGIGRRAAEWMGGMLGKAASGVWNVSLTTASSILPKLLSQYLGLPGE